MAAACTMETPTDLAPHTNRLHELYLAVHQHAAVRLVTWPPTFIPALAAELGDNFRCTVVWRGNELLGFVTTLRDGFFAWTSVSRGGSTDGASLNSLLV